MSHGLPLNKNKEISVAMLIFQIILVMSHEQRHLVLNVSHKALKQLIILSNLRSYLKMSHGRLFRTLTWVKISGDCSRIEIARSSFVLKPLIVIVEGIRGMVPQGIWKVTGMVHLNLAAIRSTFATSPIQRPLQLLI